MKKILITGGTGFLGSNIYQFLKDEPYIEIHFLTRKKADFIALTTLPDKKVFEYSQLNDTFEIECDLILHLAGKAHDLKNISEPSEYYEVNYNLTKRLFDEFIRSDAKKFIFISSVKAAADEVQGVLTENDTPDPQTHYGKSKLLAEQYIQSQPLPQGKSYFILRPCMIHGPGNKGNLNLLYKIISKGIPYPLAAFENKRSFLSVENLCFVISELLERDDVPSGVYNVADDEALSTNELIRLIGQASGKTPVLWKLSPVLIRGLARLGDILKLPLTTERLDKLTENYVVDNSKIRAALGKDLPICARDGIITTIQSFRDQKGLA